MKIETSENVDLLLHGYALGSRYDGASAVVLTIFLTALVGIGLIWVLFYLDISWHFDRRRTTTTENSVPDTAAIRNMLRRSSDMTTATSYYDDSTEVVSKSSIKPSRSRPGGCADYNRRNEQQEVRVNPLLPPFAPRQQQPPSPKDESAAATPNT